MRRLIAAVVLSVALSLSQGCALFQGKTPDVAAVNASDAAKITVEVALAAWNDYLPAAKPAVSLQMERRVRDAFLKYKAAQLALLSAAEAYNRNQGQPTLALNESELNKRAVATSEALANLISLIRQFEPKYDATFIIRAVRRGAIGCLLAGTIRKISEHHLSRWRYG